MAYLVSAIVLVLDIWTKQAATAWGDSFCKLVNPTLNENAAFSLPLGNVGGIIAGVVLLMVLNFWLHKGETGGKRGWGFGLVLGGAMGNMVDRIQIGGVTDFISCGSWPVFNLADVAITIGVALLLLRFNNEKDI